MDNTIINALKTYWGYGKNFVHSVRQYAANSIVISVTMASFIYARWAAESYGYDRTAQIIRGLSQVLSFLFLADSWTLKRSSPDEHSQAGHSHGTLGSDVPLLEDVSLDDLSENMTHEYSLMLMALRAQLKIQTGCGFYPIFSFFPFFPFFPFFSLFSLFFLFFFYCCNVPGLSTIGSL